MTISRNLILLAMALTASLPGIAKPLPVSQPAAPGQSEPAEIRLTLSNAFDLALKNNLQATLAKERVAESRGQRGIALSDLLPNLHGSAGASNQTANLAALGLTAGVFPGVRPFIGPYSVFDARLRLSQNLFAFSSYWRYQAGRRDVDAAQQQQQYVEDQLRAATGLAYLRAAQSEQSLISARADLKLAQELFTLAVNQRNAGLATGLDVTRAETRVAAEQVRVSAAKNEQDTARLELLRLIGAPLRSTLVLADEMRFAPQAPPEPEAAVSATLSVRHDLRAAEQAYQAARSQRRAAQSGYAPTISFIGDYGVSGIKPNELALPTRSVGVSLNLPIFDGGRTRNEVQVAASRERQAAAQLDDLKAAIEKDVRLAIEQLGTGEAQLRAAQQGLALATRELSQAQDRFRNGVADNIEVLNAQTSLESARQSYVASLAGYNIARLNLDAAMGRVAGFQL